MTLDIAKQSRVSVNPVVNQPVAGPAAEIPTHTISTARSSLNSAASAPLDVRSLNHGRDNLNGFSAPGADSGPDSHDLSVQGSGETATTRAATEATHSFPYKATDMRQQLRQVRELRSNLQAEVAGVKTPSTPVIVNTRGEPIKNDARAARIKAELTAHFSVPAELRGEVEVDLPPDTPGVVMLENGKTGMSAADYYLQVARSREQDLAAQEAQLLQQIQSDPTTHRAMLERQSLSATAGLRALSTTAQRMAAYELEDFRHAGRFRMDTLGGALQSLAASGKNVDQVRFGRAEQLLTEARDKGQSAPPNSLPGATPAAAGADAEGATSLGHDAMQHYLGVKHPSSSEKKAALDCFRNQVDRYLAGEKTADKPVLSGPDKSPAGALRPDEKVSLLVARTLETSVDAESLEPENKAMLEAARTPKQVRKQVDQNIKLALRGSFQTVEKHISLPASGAPGATQRALENYDSTLTPARVVAADTGNPDAFGARAVLSSDTHSPDHVPNLWTSEYKGPNGDTLFRGVRHGTLSAFGITAKGLKSLPKEELHGLIEKTLPPERRGGRTVEQIGKLMTSRFSLAGNKLRNEARAQSAMNRARELVAFNLHNNPRAMDQIRAGAARVELDMPSISLITPDRVRRIMGALGAKPQFDELRMTRDQDRALKELARQGGLEIPITDANGVTRNVKVDLKPLTFCMGVNKMAFNKAINTVSPSWGNADAISRSSIERLVGKNAKPGQEPESGLVAEHLQRLRASGAGGGPEEQAVLQLADQVTQLWQARAHHRQNNEPYALPARLALLTSKLGLTPAFNCKSGKDRTGQLDAEIKFLATRIERAGGQVPEPGAELGDKDTDIYRTIVFNSGNHEIQKMNTGHAGYKVKLSSVTRRLGSALAQLQHLGQGKFTSA